MALIVTTLIPQAPRDVAGSDRLPCDVLEIRLDHLDPEQAATAVQTVSTPVLAACRRPEDGGEKTLDEEERGRRLLAALEAGASMVDVEHDAPFREELTRQALLNGAEVIVSHHDMEGTPSVEEGLAQLASMREKADILKLATQVHGPEDVEQLFELARRAPTLGIPFALMGVGDSALRASAGPLGMALVYTAPGRVAVPGQLAVRLQATLPRAPPPPEGFRDYVLLGHPVAHSLSPRMQNAAFSWLDEPARYRPVDLPPDRFKEGFQGLKAMGVAGGNATSPHKGTLYQLCDTLRPAAEEAHAVNTFTFDGDQVRGHNTDGKGMLKALQARGEAVQDRRVVIVGAGGTARASAHTLAKAGAELVLVNRTAEKARALADEVGAERAPLEADALTSALPEGALLFNATPVDLPIADEVLSRILVFDATYGHDKAALARRAKLAGTRALDGLDLLVHQGDLALRFWLDLAADEDLLGVMSTAAHTRALERRYQAGDA